MLGFLSRFVDSNDRELRRIQPLVDRTNELEPEMQERSDGELRAFVDELREEILEVLVVDVETEIADVQFSSHDIHSL